MKEAIRCCLGKLLHESRTERRQS